MRDRQMLGETTQGTYAEYVKASAGNALLIPDGLSDQQPPVPTKKLQKAGELGADGLINYTEKNFLQEVKRLTNERGVDIVFEHVGKSTLEKCIKASQKGGRLGPCGATKGCDPIYRLALCLF